MAGLIDSLLRRATRAGMRRGLAGGHWAWLVIAAAAYVLRRARRPEDRVERIDLRPGDRYLVTLQRRPGRHETGDGPGDRDAGARALAKAMGAHDAPQALPTPG
ncbi:MAG TPA: hypothetical protein VMD28_03560 [Acidimicrobiales bacterium]|nr:hypothetical protein [Acidimicrobiales bacterium]